MTSHEARRMSRNYALAALGSVLPFLLLVVVLAAYQFNVQRDQLLNELEDDAIEHNVLLGSILKSVHDHVRSLETWATTHAVWLQSGPLPPPPEGDAWAPARARLVRDPEHEEADGAAKLLVAHELLPHMRLAHEAMPYLRWSWFVDPQGRFMSLVPVYAQPGMNFDTRDRRTRLLRLLADRPATGARAGARWGEPFFDPVSGSWLVARQSTATLDGEPVGTVGAAVMLDFLTGFLRAFDYTAGRAWLLDPSGRILAASAGPVVAGMRLQGIEDVLPAELAARSRELLGVTSALERIGASYVFTQPVGETGWRLLFLAGAGEVNDVLWPRFTPYIIILAALVLTLLLAHQLRERLIIRPALALVEFIRAESQDEAPARPALPPLWRPWVDAVAEAFLAKRRSVEQIRDDAERLRALANAHPVPLAVVPFDDSRLVYANPAFAELFRISAGGVSGTDVRDLYDPPRAVATFLRRLRQDGFVRSFQGMARRSDGSTFPASLTSELTRFDGRDAIVIAVLDLTEQKAAEAEIDRQREALHQSEKLNALGSMLASVAHELNNPLSVVVGYATMMRDLTDDPASRDRAVRIHAAAERCARIVRTFLAMARRKPECRRAIRIEQVVDAALEIAGYGLRTTDIAVSIKVEPDLPEVHGDPDQLTLVVMNLIVNAQHALQTMSPPRRLDITLAAADQGVRIEILDNGPGISPELRARIFEPFFTTKPQGVGTGIGLSVCRNIVLAHDGDIEVLAPDGGGTLFRITLPAEPGSPPAVSPAGSIGPAAEPAKIAGRILVVEDEDEIAEMMLEMLERDGHEVAIVRSGREALGRLEGAPVDLIISDLHMPDLDGPELHRLLLERRPELAERMVFMTGDVLGAEVNGFLAETRIPVIDKPIDPYDIRIRVRDRLERLRRPPA